MRIVLTTNIDELRQRLADSKELLPSALAGAANTIGTQLTENLHDAAPQGKGESSPPGDEPGPLANSFIVQDEGAPSEFSAAISVQTTQPTKLEYVTKGTGVYGPNGQRIYPKVKKALYWPEATHPVKSVAGQKPNDFVTPVVEGFSDERTLLETSLEEIKTILGG